MCINIGGILHFSLLDYPGKISAVIFTQGCPLRCVYCHNPSFQDPGLKTNINFDDVITFLKTRIGLLEGIVFSGGEPLLQKQLYNAINVVKCMGFLIGLHTSGCIYDNFIKVLPLIDWVGFDIKQVFSKYYDITQVTNSEFHVMKSFNALVKSNKEYEVRTTVDTRHITYENLLNIAKYLKQNNVKEWTLQKCIIRGESGNINLPFLSNEEIHELEQYVKINIR